jgi:hypothetical protein
MRILKLFHLFIIDKKLVVISYSKMNKIKEDMRINGRFSSISKFLKERSSRTGSDIANKIIRKYKFPDKDYFQLISKYGNGWVISLLRANKWEYKEIDEYIDVLHKTFD